MDVALRALHVGCTGTCKQEVPSQTGLQASRSTIVITMLMMMMMMVMMVVMVIVKWSSFSLRHKHLCTIIHGHHRGGKAQSGKQSTTTRRLTHVPPKGASEPEFKSRGSGVMCSP